MRKMTRSVFLAVGASIFLFSEHALANTVIYDPLDPHNAITPIANEEQKIETNNTQKTDGKLALEKEADRLPIVVSPKSAKKIIEAKKVMQDVVPKDAYLLDKQQTKSKKTAVFPSEPYYLSPLQERRKNQVLMLNDEFFAPMEIAALLPEGNATGGDDADEWTEIAQSAYVLLGLVLYGQGNGKLEARVSDDFAG